MISSTETEDLYDFFYDTKDELLVWTVDHTYDDDIWKDTTSLKCVHPTSYLYKFEYYILN